MKRSNHQCYFCRTIISEDIYMKTPILGSNYKVVFNSKFGDFADICRITNGKKIELYHNAPICKNCLIEKEKDGLLVNKTWKTIFVD